MTPIQAVNNNPFGSAYAVQAINAYGGGSSVAKIGTPGGGQTITGRSDSNLYGVNPNIKVGDISYIAPQQGRPGGQGITRAFA